MDYKTKIPIPFNHNVAPVGTIVTWRNKKSLSLDGSYVAENFGWWSRGIVENNPGIFEAIPEPLPKIWTDEDMVAFRSFVPGIAVNFHITSRNVLILWKQQRGIE